MQQNNQGFLKTVVMKNNLVCLNEQKGLVYIPGNQIDPDAGNNGQIFKGYIGYNTNQQLECCVKRFSIPTYNKQLFDKLNLELILGRQLNHKNIVKYYECSTSQNNFYIFMEYCEQGSLAQMMSLGYEDELMSTKQFPEDWSIEMMSQIIDALIYMRQLSFDGRSGAVHRDIKPDNIMFSNNVPKLIDFGMSRFMDLSNVTPHKGSPIYMSPQNLKSERYDLEKNDVWGIGIILFQLVEGVYPWRSELQDIRDLICAQEKLKQNIVYTNKTSQKLQDLITNMLKYDEKDRYDWEQVLNHEVMKPYFKYIFEEINEIKRLILNYELYEKLKSILKINDLEKYVLDLTLNKIHKFKTYITLDTQLDQKIKELYIKRILQKRKFHTFKREILMKSKLQRKLVKHLELMTLENENDAQIQSLRPFCQIIISLYKEDMIFDHPMSLTELLELAKI
ncbi:unnamed protein product [Paramecium sonneborni]|uniref:Protein kinase domain-containing protein n=1 Tax=Paramecium sonneborni TaxID=65129 RepID=A0A8S1N328_9CILI|nr:unnamed protein product [Paramecium sonneborni]